jgi:hypothetical protein
MVVLLGGAALGAPQVMAWFTQEADSLTAGVYLLRVLSLGYLAQTLTLVFIGALSGAGDTILPMAVNLVSLWLVQIPLALILPGPLRMGENGLWLALGVGWILQAALLGWYYRRGNWKLQKPITRRAMQFYYIRHGQSANNQRAPQTGSTVGRCDDAELTRRGPSPAEYVAAFLAAVSAEPGAALRLSKRGRLWDYPLYSQPDGACGGDGTIISRSVGVPLVGWQGLARDWR